MTWRSLPKSLDEEGKAYQPAGAHATVAFEKSICDNVQAPREMGARKDITALMPSHPRNWQREYYFTDPVRILPALKKGCFPAFVEYRKALGIQTCLVTVAVPLSFPITAAYIVASLLVCPLGSLLYQLRAIEELSLAAVIPEAALFAASSFLAAATELSAAFPTTLVLSLLSAAKATLRRLKRQRRSATRPLLLCDGCVEDPPQPVIVPEDLPVAVTTLTATEVTSTSAPVDGTDVSAASLTSAQALPSRAVVRRWDHSPLAEVPVHFIWKLTDGTIRFNYVNRQRLIAYMKAQISKLSSCNKDLSARRVLSDEDMRGVVAVALAFVAMNWMLERHVNLVYYFVADLNVLAEKLMVLLGFLEKDMDVPLGSSLRSAAGNAATAGYLIGGLQFLSDAGQYGAFVPTLRSWIVKLPSGYRISTKAPGTATDRAKKIDRSQRYLAIRRGNGNSGGRENIHPNYNGYTRPNRW